MNNRNELESIIHDLRGILDDHAELSRDRLLVACIQLMILKDERVLELERQLEAPRVMSLEDALASSECWIEMRVHHRICDYFAHVRRGDDYAGNAVFCVESGKHTYVCDKNTYNRDWRCWTKDATEEQREAVKWDDATGTIREGYARP